MFMNRSNVPPVLLLYLIETFDENRYLRQNDFSKLFFSRQFVDNTAAAAATFVLFIAALLENKV